MTTARLARWEIALMCLACWGCSQSQPPPASLPTAPSPPPLAFVAGTYNLTVRHCNLSGASAPPVEESFPSLYYKGSWQLSQSGGDVSGSTSGSFANIRWLGTLTGRVVSVNTVEITTFNYWEGGTHGTNHSLSGTGTGLAEASGIIFGTFAGDYKSLPTFGVGDIVACHGAEMPLRLWPTP
jgi:hypothetical protein